MMIGERRCDDDGGCVDNALGEVLGECQVVLELQMRPVFCGRAERDDDDGVRGENPFGLGPGKIAQASAGFRRLCLRHSDGKGTKQRHKRHAHTSPRSLH
jgi:hypothetical protein